MKTTWTTIHTTGIFPRNTTRIAGSTLTVHLEESMIKDIERGRGKTSAIGFVPFGKPMGKDFGCCMVTADKLWAWHVRIDRVSVPMTTVKIQAQQYIADGLPNMAEMERKAYDAMKAKKRASYIEEKIKRQMIMDTPASINLVDVYLDMSTGIIRVCSHKSSSATRFVLGWLEKLGVAWRQMREAQHEGVWVTSREVKTPEAMLIEKFDGNPANLLDVIPGTFNCAMNDGDQVEIDPKDVEGMKQRLEHFKRDFLTWLSYRAVAGERISLPPVSLDRGACTVDCTVSDTCTIRIGNKSFVDVEAKDPVMDVSTRAALKNGAKIARAHFKFTVGYANGMATKHDIDLGADLMPVDVNLSTGKDYGESADRILRVAHVVDQMSDVEDILRRLFVFFAVLRAGARWPFEREAMMTQLYTLDSMPNAPMAAPTVKLRRADEDDDVVEPAQPEDLELDGSDDTIGDIDSVIDEHEEGDFDEANDEEG